MIEESKNKNVNIGDTYLVIVDGGTPGISPSNIGDVLTVSTIDHEYNEIHFNNDIVWDKDEFIEVLDDWFVLIGEPNTE